jgi:hypothetical protein
MGVRAGFSGIGKASSISFNSMDGTANVTKITVNGQVACSPCSEGEAYPADAEGDIAVEILAKEAAVGAPAGAGFIRRAFFEKNVRTGIDALVGIEVGGGWLAIPDASMPSSFYGVDAPFHIHRVPIGASHALRMQWPWAEYTFLSMMPASAIYTLLGGSHQYAYKLWEIALFFLPVAMFYLFSRKLSHGRDAVFLFASLTYLFLPSQGMLVGGGADLFMYGMAAHTLATSLSLFSLFFAYEFAVERRGGSFWPALLLFALAVASNQRILVSLSIGMGVLFAFSLVASGARRAALLGAACAAATAFLLAPFAANEGFAESYSALGGASTEGIGWAVVGFFQLGYYALPLLFFAGVAAAVSRKEMFLLFLFASSALVFAFAMSPEVNRLAPFLDGLRFMPSFFLPVFFISGAGALLMLEHAIVWMERIGKRLKLDRLDSVVSFSLAILLPFSVLFASAALSTMEQYQGEANSLVVASEYSDLEAIYGRIGDGCVFIQGGGDVSFYPIYDEGLERSIISGFGSPDEIAGAMEKARCGHLILGNAKTVAGAAENTRWEEYAVFKSDPRFAEIPYGGSPRLFALEGVVPAEKAEIAGGRINGCSFDYDRGTVSGECLSGNCSLRIRQDALPASLACSNCRGAGLRLDAGERAFYVEGIRRGKFDIALEPHAADWLFPLVLSGAIVALGCWHIAGKDESEPRGKRR